VGSEQERTVALCVTGSIAAFKAVELARLLVKEHVRVIPVMTASAQRFVGAVTFAGICAENVAVDMWDPSFPGEMHVAIARRADVVAVVPATADAIARLAQGSASDLVSAVALCARGAVVLAPAMHPRMWAHPATQANVARLVEQGRVTLVGPVHGEVASGEIGLGRMAEPPDVMAAIVAHFSPPDLGGRRLLVTAGPTLEDVDPVRFIGNRSTGKMGFAVAERAAARGAEVTLVAGPSALPTPPSVRRIDVRGALEMREALWQALGSDLSGADAVVMAAAVADYRPLHTSDTKMKRTSERASIELVRNPDILAEIGAARPGRRPVLVGFAVETASGGALVEEARRKLVQKKVDLVVANEAETAFGGDDNRLVLVSASDAEATATQSKRTLADAILHRLRRLLEGGG
jgi:phosphopantothenoylcysteine decarboxylase/phosphopantothenate--cysteine ligase